MIRLYLIRHGKTYGNTLGRYIGTTDEELCEEGREGVLALARAVRDWPRKPQAIYVSPLLRCRQTAELLFPGVPSVICPGLRECDFGEFENHSYRELSGNPSYQAWVDSGGTLPFPGGESREGFQRRCEKGFRNALEELRGRCMGQADPEFCAAFVVHGGTIMSILSAFAVPKEEFYHWQIGNAEGFCARWDETDKGGIRLYEITHIGPASGLSS